MKKNIKVLSSVAILSFLLTACGGGNPTSEATSIGGSEFESQEVTSTPSSEGGVTSNDPVSEEVSNPTSYEDISVGVTGGTDYGKKFYSDNYRREYLRMFDNTTGTGHHAFLTVGDEMWITYHYFYNPINNRDEDLWHLQQENLYWQKSGQATKFPGRSFTMRTNR